MLLYRFVIALFGLFTVTAIPLTVSAQHCALNIDQCKAALSVPCDSTVRRLLRAEDLGNSSVSRIVHTVEQSQNSSTAGGAGVSYGIFSVEGSGAHSNASLSRDEAISQLASATYQSLASQSEEHRFTCEANLRAWETCVVAVISSCSTHAQEFSITATPQQVTVGAAFSVRLVWTQQTATSVAPRFETQPIVTDGATCRAISVRAGATLRNRREYVVVCRRNAPGLVSVYANTTATDFGISLPPLCGTSGDVCCAGNECNQRLGLVCGTSGRCVQGCLQMAGRWRRVFPVDGLELDIRVTESCQISANFVDDPNGDRHLFTLSAQGPTAHGTVRRHVTPCVEHLTIDITMPSSSRLGARVSDSGECLNVPSSYRGSQDTQYVRVVPVP